MSNYSGKRLKLRNLRRKRTRFRIRSKMHGTAEKPRLAVNKSLNYIYAQLIDDDRGHTIAQASSRDGDVKDGLKGSTSCKEAARRVGELIAKRAKEQGVGKVVFDRGGFVFHGKIREVAEGARSEGLEF